MNEYYILPNNSTTPTLVHQFKSNKEYLNYYMNNPQDTDKPSLVLVMDQNNTMRVVRDTDSILTNIVKDYTKPQTQKISKSILSLIKQYKLNYLLNESKK